MRIRFEGDFASPSMPAASARFDLLQLGREPRLVRADGTVGMLEQKDALLLAYLYVEGPTPRRRLATLLWPDVDDERARANLRQRLFRLRKSLGRELLEGGEVAGLCADLRVELEAREAEGGAFLQGLAEPLGGELAEWLERAREQHRAGRIRTVGDESSRLEVAGQLVAALAAAERLVDLDPTSEHAHRRLMRLHYLRGDRAAAIAAFDRCCDVLERTLGVAPDSETEALRARVAESSLPAGGSQPRPLPVSVLRPPRLVGREAEWQHLHADWSAGHPSLVAGEAGLGKSRLVNDFARAQPGALAVDARPGDARVPHTLLARLLRVLLARLSQPLDGGVAAELAPLLPELCNAAPRRSAGNAALAAAVEAVWRQGLAEGISGLIVDDLQFADAASVEAMQQLAAAGLGLRWIVAFRAHELAPAAQAFHDRLLGVHGARLQVLQPLAVEQVGVLIDSLDVAGFETARLAPALARHTGGNPLFLLETLKLMLAPATVASPPEAGHAATAQLPAQLPARLPAASGVVHLIGQRIGRLSPMAVKLARCAAIAGADFSAELAASVLGLRAIDLSDAWSELDAAQVLCEGAFAHDLIFEAARGSVPAPIARQLHAEMAAFLEARVAEPAHIAQHWRDAGESLKALPWLVAAAGRAGAAWRPAEEGALLLLAARIARNEGKDRTRAFELLRLAHKAHLQANLGSPAHLECLDLLCALAVHPLEHGYAHFARADSLGQLTDGPAAESEARRGLAAIAGETGRAADELHVDLVSALANGLFIQDRPGPGAEAVRAVESRMLALGDRHREIEHYANLGVLLDAGNRHVEAQAALGHVISLTRAEGDRTSELVVLSNLASSLHDVGKVSAALLPLREALSMKERYPELRTSAVFVQVQMGNMHRALGDYGEALRWLNEGLTILGDYVPQMVGAAHHALARLWLDLGQAARARQELQRSLAIASGPPMFHALAHLLAARMALAQGQRGAAADALAAAGNFIIDSTRYAVRAQAALLAGQLEDPEAAYSGAMQVAREAGRLHMMGVRIDALVFAARAATACGRPAVAASHALEALGLWPEHAPDSLYIGEVWLAALDSLGNAADASAILGDAVRWIAATAARLPDEFREAFLDRNPLNRALLTRVAARPLYT